MIPVHQDLAAGVTCIETHYHRPGLAACYLIRQGEEAAIVDTGTARTTPHILALLRYKGIAPEQVRYVVPTHVHLDHAGGSGQLMAALPEARLLAHPRGAAHLIDPTRLRAGTVAVYGEETFRREYGELLPVPAERVVAVEDGFRFRLEERSFTCLDSPGHARHHFCVWDPESRGLFTGDTFGISYPELTVDGRPFMFLPSTPVQFDPDAWHRTLERLLEPGPERIFLTHYGEVQGPAGMAQALHGEIDAYAALALASADSEAPAAAIEQRLREHILDRLARHGCNIGSEEFDYLLGMDIHLCAQGLEVWLRRRQGSPG